MTYYLVVFLLFGYIRGSGVYKETWDGECNIIIQPISMYRRQVTIS